MWGQMQHLIFRTLQYFANWNSPKTTKAQTVIVYISQCQKLNRARGVARVYFTIGKKFLIDFLACWSVSLVSAFTRTSPFNTRFTGEYVNDFTKILRHVWVGLLYYLRLRHHPRPAGDEIWYSVSFLFPSGLLPTFCYPSSRSCIIFCVCLLIPSLDVYMYNIFV